MHNDAFATALAVGLVLALGAMYSTRRGGPVVRVGGGDGRRCGGMAGVELAVLCTSERVVSSPIDQGDMGRSCGSESVPLSLLSVGDVAGCAPRVGEATQLAGALCPRFIMLLLRRGPVRSFGSQRPWRPCSGELGELAAAAMPISVRGVCRGERRAGGAARDT